MVQIKSLLHWNQQFDVTFGVYDKPHSGFVSLETIGKNRSANSGSPDIPEKTLRSSQSPIERMSATGKCWPLKISRN